MALCFSPVGDEGLRRRARQFPALVNRTVIDWFQPWPKQALRNVAASFLKEVDFISEAIRENVIDFMPYSFERVNKASEEMLPKERRYVYTTPKSFLELIKLFKTMFNRKKDELESSKGRYQLCLEKLQEAAASASQLEKELQVMQAEVEAKKSEADKVTEVVGKEKEKVMKEIDKANVEADKAQRRSR
jgi:dynein heavy chain